MFHHSVPAVVDSQPYSALFEELVPDSLAVVAPLANFDLRCCSTGDVLAAHKVIQVVVADDIVAEDDCNYLWEEGHSSYSSSRCHLDH